MIKAKTKDIDRIWSILQQAIVRRKLEGSNQWQDGYPNPTTIQNDIEKGWAYVLIDQKKIVAYGAIIPNYEPAYDALKGQWLTTDSFIVLHRVAVAEEELGRGYALGFFNEAASLAIGQNIYSIKVDTNFDNVAMLYILKKLGYTYCGKVYFRGSERMAFEKVLK